jgi:hypothetical protein
MMASGSRLVKTPTVGGEPARLVLDTIRSFPLSLDGSGRVVVHEITSGEAAAAFERAYAAIELEFLVEITRCAHPEEHRTLDERDYRFLVLSDLAWKAKKALGETGRLEAMWRT